MNDRQTDRNTEAKRISSEKGLPFEFVRGMLQWSEEHDISEENPFSPSQKHTARPIPESKLSAWAEGAADIFKSIMPEIGIPYPDIYYSTARLFGRHAPGF